MSTSRAIRPILCAFIILLFGVTTARAQLTWNITYADTNSGFADPTVVGSTTVGAQRQATMTAVTSYISSVIDARGSINLFVNASGPIGGGALAEGGPQYSWTTSPFQTGFINGQPFTHATTGSGSATDAQAQFNFTNFTWNNTTADPTSTQNDLYSVALHEFTHALGFSTVANFQGFPPGPGLQNSAIGSPDLYSRFDMFLQTGNLTGTTLIDRNTASFVANPNTVFTNDNLYFNGPNATAANGGNNLKLVAVNPDQGSNTSHIDALPTDTSVVMKPNIQIGTMARTYNGFEVGALLDLGYNNFNWNNTQGNWSDSISNAMNSRWQNVEGANMLAPVGTITYNLILRFGGDGSSQYTSTNDLANPFKINQLILQSTSSATNTIAGSRLEFGYDNGFNVTPQIQQTTSGAFNINTDITIYKDPSSLLTKSLILTGDGSGRVTLNGTIGASSDGATLLKSGASTYALTGNNLYTGGTIVSGGKLLVNNISSPTSSGTGSGLVMVMSGATVGGTGRIGGGLSVLGGGILAPGDIATGTLTVAGASTLGDTGAASFSVRLNSSTLYDQLAIESGGSLNLANVNLNPLLGASYTPGLNDMLFIIDNQNSTGGLTGTFNGLATDGSSFMIGSTAAFVYYHGNFTGDANSSLFGGNDVVLTFSIAPVPEPACVLGIGACGLFIITWWRRRGQTSSAPATMSSC